MRRLAQTHDEVGRLAVLAGLRSRRGFERALSTGLTADAALVRHALLQAGCVMTQAFLLPLVPGADMPSAGDEATWRLLAEALRQAVPGSARHLALVEAARRLHKQAAMAADRADKERRLSQ